jgi:Ulp1 family protease
MNVHIDGFYPLLVLLSFIWFDVNKIQREQKRIKAMGKSNLNESLPIELINQDMNRLRLGNFLSDHLNSRYTALFGKITGVIIGGYNLIFSLY